MSSILDKIKLPDGGGKPPTEGGGKMTNPQMLSIASMGLSLLGGISGAKEARQVGEYNKAIYDKMAEDTARTQKYTEQQYGTKATQLQGAVIARTAASGLQFTGSPVDSLVTSLTNLGIDQAIEQENLKAKETYYKQAGKVELMEAKALGNKALFTAGTSILTQGADYMEKYWKKKPKETPKDKKGIY